MINVELKGNWLHVGQTEVNWYDDRANWLRGTGRWFTTTHALPINAKIHSE